MMRVVVFVGKYMLQYVELMVEITVTIARWAVPMWQVFILIIFVVNVSLLISV